MANTIAQLAVRLGLETSEFTQGLNAAKRGLQEFAGLVSSAEKIAAVAFTAMVAKSLEYSDQMSDLADSTEFSIASILKISDALEMSGGHADNASKMLSKFAQSVDGATHQSKPLFDAFQRIGISMDELNHLSMEALFNKATKNIAAMTEATSRAGASFEIFGKTIRGVDMKEFSVLVQESSQKWMQYQAAIQMAADMHDKLAQKTTMLMLVFTKEVMPTISAMFEAMSGKGGVADEVFTGLKYTLIGMWDVMGGIADVSARAAANWHAFNTNTWNSGEHLNALNEIMLTTYNREKKLNELRKEHADPVYKEPPGSNRGGTPPKDAEAEKLKQMLYTASLISDEYARQQQFSIQQLITRGLMNNATTDEKRIQQAVNEQLDATSKKIDDIRKQQLAAAGRGGSEEVRLEFEKQIVAVQKLGDAYVATAKNFSTWQIAQERTFTYGWNKAFKQYAEDAYNYGKMGEESFSAVTRNMSSAIDKFVDTGKLSFSDLAKSIIKDLLRIQMQYMAMQMFAGASSWLGSLFSIGSGAATGGAYGSMGGAAGMGGSMGTGLTFAEGGVIDQPSIVGENGAELFIPSRSGTIIPHNDLGNALGGQTINYNGTYVANMSAIDTQSATAFLARNKSAVWAANQSASRSNPTNR